VVHQPVSRGLAVFADAWLSGWLAEISADLRETVAHQRWCHNDVLYESTTLLFFHSLSEHLAQRDDSADDNILTASLLEDWKKILQRELRFVARELIHF